MIKVLMYLYLMILNSLGMGNNFNEESISFKLDPETAIAITINTCSNNYKKNLKRLTNYNWL